MNHEENKLVAIVPTGVHRDLLDADWFCYKPGRLAVPVRTSWRGSYFLPQYIFHWYKKKLNPFIMLIEVEEIGTTNDSTASQMFVDRRPFCFVVEDGYRPVKIRGETRIPAGRYQVAKRMHGKFYTKYNNTFGHEFSLEIKDVPGFQDILIHTGNKVNDTRGCLLVNRNIGIQTAPRDYCGTDSTSVYKLLYMLVKAAFERGEEVWIEIYRRPVVDENTPVG